MLTIDIKRYEEFLHNVIFKLPGVTHVRSRIVLREVKAEVALPIPSPAPASAAPARVRKGRQR